MGGRRRQGHERSVWEWAAAPSSVKPQNPEGALVSPHVSQEVPQGTSTGFHHISSSPHHCVTLVRSHPLLCILISLLRVWVRLSPRLFQQEPTKHPNCGAHKWEKQALPIPLSHVSKPHLGDFPGGPGRSINHLRYADDTTLMAESKEELKSLLMKAKRRVLA